MSDNVVTACVLLIGNELLSGRTQDINLAFLAKRLNAQGIQVKEVRIIADEEAAIVAAVNECRATYDYVFTTGGIGPTHDDITSPSVAKAFGVELIRHPEALRLITGYYKPGDLNDARLRMTEVPKGATLISNPVSLAPGFQMDNVFVMAGVPRIMHAMFDGIKDRLAGGRPVVSRAIAAFLPEGLIAKGLGDLQARFDDVEIGSYPFARHGRFGATLVLRSPDAARVDQAADALKDFLRSLGGEPVEEGENDGGSA
ncbi:MAG: competence/damage-inducible protein A [Rhodospirillales bacterium]|nr:competence/damage-inducible protein A [Rhodospirillales bacterium]